jgi:hypothetical protein
MTIQTVDEWIAESKSDIVHLIKDLQYHNLTKKNGIDYQYAVVVIIPGFYDITSDQNERHLVLESVLEYADAPVAFIGHSTGMTLLFVSFTDALSFKLKNG